ncbi:MAG: 16S rRNA (adenine(1518)-N(6)/adenine(1519)-N(6))-dimethyltransferase RsmA [Acidimicrobiia bacterium]
MLSPGDVRGLLTAHGIRPSRALGQNFLADPNTARRIVRLAGVAPGDRVLEVGPGVGSLTLALADEVGPEGSVTALELDRHLVPLLAEVLADRRWVRVVEGDALTVDYDDLLGGANATMVSNLPYNVATPLIVRLLEEVPGLVSLVVLVQREVAERLAAAPGTRECGAVSVKVAFFTRPSVLAVVPPTVFVPRPRVESALVAFDRLGVPPVEVPSPARLFELARAGFAQRRKMLRHALGPLLGPTTIDLLVAAGLDPTARAEALSLEQWAALARTAVSP